MFKILAQTKNINSIVKSLENKIFKIRLTITDFTIMYVHNINQALVSD